MPPRFRFQLRSVTLLLGATLVVAGCASGSAARAPGAQPSHQAAPAPAGALRLRMAGFAGGPDYVLPDDLAGRPLVLNVWASWCGPCRLEMPAFEQVYRQAAGQVGFLGLDNRDQADAAQQFVTKTGVTYRLAADPRGDVAARLGVVGLPTTLFIAADGTVRHRRVGAMTADDLRAAIRTYLGVTVP